MKKIILILIIAVGLISCKKNQDLAANTTFIQKVQKDLASINAKYKREKGNNVVNLGPRNIKPRWSFKTWCNIISRDVTGAVAGARAGGYIGGAVGSLLPGAGTATGATVGAVAGGVVVGGMASYGATPSHQLSTQQSDNVGNIDPYVVLSNPHENPYDESVGMRHNALLKEWLSENGGEVTDSDVCNPFWNSDESIFRNEDPDNLGDFVFENNFDNADFLESSLNDAVMFTIIKSFLDGINEFEEGDENLLIEFANDYEEYINQLIEEESISTDQAQILLEGMAVAKYSAYFWGQIQQ